MLERRWRNWNAHMLLLGMSDGTAAVEDSLVIPQNDNHRVSI